MVKNIYVLYFCTNSGIIIIILIPSKNISKPRLLPSNVWLTTYIISHVLYFWFHHRLDSSSVFLGGGSSNDTEISLNQAWLYDGLFWKPIKAMKNERQNFACSVVYNEDDEVKKLNHWSIQLWRNHLKFNILNLIG